MKSSYYNRVTALVLLAMAVGLIVAAASAVGQAQGRRSRDRSNRITRPAGSSGVRVIRSAEPNAVRVIRSVEPNAVAPDAAQAATASTPASDAAAKSEAAPSTGTTEQQDRWAAYDIIRQRNIFSRNRVAYRPPDEAAPKPVAPDPETYFVLRGVVQENNQFIAFIEDTQGGRFLRLRQNDSVARGVLKSLSLDSVEYQFGDKTITINIGSDLEGGRGAVATGEPSDYPQNSSSAAQPAETGQQSTPSGNEGDILKRLMEQRRQQLGQ
jgi:hypothetical protein